MDNTWFKGHYSVQMTTPNQDVKVHFKGHYAIDTGSMDAEEVAARVIPMAKGHLYRRNRYNKKDDAILNITHPKGIEIMCDDRQNANVRDTFSWALERQGYGELTLQEDLSIPMDTRLVQAIGMAIEQGALNSILSWCKSFETIHTEIQSMLREGAKLFGVSDCSTHLTGWARFLQSLDFRRPSKDVFRQE